MANRSSSRYLWLASCIAYGALILNLCATPTEVIITAAQWEIISARLDTLIDKNHNSQLYLSRLLIGAFGTTAPSPALGIRIANFQITDLLDGIGNVGDNVNYWGNIIADFQFEIQNALHRQEASLQGMSNHLQWVEHYLIAVEEHMVLDDFPVQIEIRDATRNISVVLTNLYDLIASGISINGNVGLDDGTGSIESDDDPIDHVTMAEAMRDEAESDWTIAGTNYMSLPGMIDVKPDDGPLDIAQADLLDKAQEPGALTFAIPTASQLAISFATFPAAWGFPQELILDWDSIPGVALMRGALVALIWAGFALACIRGFE